MVYVWSIVMALMPGGVAVVALMFVYHWGRRAWKEYRDE